MYTLRDVITRSGWADPSAAASRSREPSEDALRAVHVGPAVGIDVGGTKIHAVAWVGGHLRESIQQVAPAGGRDAVVQIDRLCRALTDGAAPAALTVGVPGTVNPTGGHLEDAPNLPGWDAFDAAGALQEVCGCPVRVENDVNLAAWGEHVWRGAPDVAFVAVGTGVGVGLVLGGRLHRGHRGAAGEVFDVPAVPTFPHEGAALEDVVSGPGLARTFALLTGEVRSTYAILEDYPSSEHARQAVTALARPLGHLVYAISSLVDPSALVLGGGLGAREDILQAVRAELGRFGGRVPHLQASALGARAAAVGALARSLHAQPRGHVETVGT